MRVRVSQQLSQYREDFVNNSGTSYAYLRNIDSSVSNHVVSTSNASNPLLLSQTLGSVSAGQSFGIRVNSLSSSFDILSFRIAEATQKWKEVTQCAKQGYKSN